MSVLEHSVPVFNHGITPVRLDERYEFCDLQQPARFSLEEGAIQMTYLTRSREVQGQVLHLLVLCVHDQDPVGNAKYLSNWTYEESYELMENIYHLWWRLAPPFSASNPAS